jgi:hypothetical protein
MFAGAMLETSTAGKGGAKEKMGNPLENWAAVRLAKGKAKDRDGARGIAQMSAMQRKMKAQCRAYNRAKERMKG